MSTNKSNSSNAATDLPIRPSQQSLPLALLRTREAVMGWYRPLLAELDVTEQQWRVIRLLFECKRLEISELARQTSILPPSMSGILKRLEAREMIKRTPDTQDQRRVWISLRQPAIDLMNQAAPKSEAITDLLEAEIGGQRVAELIRTLDEVCATAQAKIPADGKDPWVG